MEWEEQAPWPLRSSGQKKGKPAAMSLKLGVACNRIRSRWVRSSNEPGDSELPSSRGIEMKITVDVISRGN